MIGDGKMRIMLLVALLVAGVVAAVVAPLDVWTRGLVEADLWRSPRGVIIFILLYVVWNFAFPPAPLQLLAGLHYGLGGGLATIIVGTTLANVISHGVGRALGRHWVASQVKNSDRLSALEQAIDKMGWKAVALLRLSNLLPSNLANLLMGATPLQLSTILWASIVGSLPGWALMLGFGHGGRMVIDSDVDPSLPWGFYALAGVAALVLLAAIGKRAHTILEETGESG